MYKKIVAIGGTKGGVGKTSISHLLAHGLTRFGVRAIMMTTDSAVGRKVLPSGDRAYIIYGGQSDTSFKQVLKAFSNFDVSNGDPAILVIDGGGNRADTDNAFSSVADLMILPFRDSEEDVRVVMADMQRLENAIAIPSAWPTNVFAATSAKGLIDGVSQRFGERIMEPVPLCRASQQLLREEPGRLDTNVNSIAKRLAENVLNLLGEQPLRRL